MDLSDVDLMNYQTEREMYRAGKLGFVELPRLERNYEAERALERRRQSRWARFCAAAKRIFDRLVEEGVDR